MSKKIIVLFGIFVLAIVLAMIILSRSTGKTVSPVGKPAPTKKLAGELLETYKNSAGFEFKYPQSAKITEEDINNNSIYASLKITSDDNPGSISVLVTDTDYENLDQYLSGEKLAGFETRTLTLGDIDAKEVTTETKTVIGAIDQGVLFQIEINPETSKEYWSQVKKTLITAFSFVEPETPSGETTENTGTDYSTEGEIIDEGEEIIE